MDTTPTRAELTPQLLSSFAPARVLRKHHKPVSCLSFSQDGRHLVSSSPDDTIVLYDALQGTANASIPVQKYGAGVLRFIQDDDPPTVVVASTTADHRIRALDLHHSQYVRSFDAHDSQVVSISASPQGPNFISSSRDACVMLWDARQETPLGKLRASGTPLVEYDPKGLIFGLAYNAPGLKTMVKLYDARLYNDGPFLEFLLDNLSDSVPSCLKFSSDGEYFLLVNADVNATVSVYDAYKGACFRSFSGHRNASGVPLEASFSPDSAYISTGSDDGSIYMWALQSEKLLLEKPAVHAMPSACSVWNPVYSLFASACQNLLLWLPQHNYSAPPY